LTLVERLGCGGHALGRQHGVAREHAAPPGVRFGERHHGLPVSTPGVTDATRSLPLVPAIANALSTPLVDLRTLSAATLFAQRDPMANRDG
jgi:hypothetical protein